MGERGRETIREREREEGERDRAVAIQQARFFHNFHNFLTGELSTARYHGYPKEKKKSRKCQSNASMTYIFLYMCVRVFMVYKTGLTLTTTVLAII